MPLVSKVKILPEREPLKPVGYGSAAEVDFQTMYQVYHRRPRDRYLQALQLVVNHLYLARPPGVFVHLVYIYVPPAFFIELIGSIVYRMTAKKDVVGIDV